MYICIYIYTLVGRRTDGGRTGDKRRMDGGWTATDGGQTVDPMYDFAKLVCMVDF